MKSLIISTGLRAKGFTWLNFCVTLSLFFNQFANAPALEALAWKYYIFYCVFLVFEIFIIYFYLVETRYTPMEEIARYFDGDKAMDIVDVTNEQVKVHDEKEMSVQEVEVSKRV